MENKHKKFIRRSLYLANKGMGEVFPNPMVGCVIVKENKIIGEGYHKKFGGAHAEINAINNVINKNDIEGASVYVSLEPCTHFGKTPPCTDKLIEYKPKEVIISNTDPNPLVNGKGIKKLRNNNINVISGVLEKEDKKLNKRFFINQEKKRPYIILKWAETSDGFIAKKDGSSKWISCKTSRTLVHKWRSEETGILIGVNTANKDNARLNVRLWEGRDPIRVILDPNNKLEEKTNILNDESISLIYNNKQNKIQGQKHFIKISPFKLENIYYDLYKREIYSLLVEGGGFTLNKIIEKNLWDEARVFKSQLKFSKGIKAPNIKKNIYEKIGEDKLFKITRNA